MLPVQHEREERAGFLSNNQPVLDQWMENEAYPSL